MNRKIVTLFVCMTIFSGAGSAWAGNDNLLDASTESEHLTPKVIMPFGFYSTADGEPLRNKACINYLKPLADSGVSFLGPYYGVNDNARQDCYAAAQALGMKAIKQLVPMGADGQRPVIFVDKNLPVYAAPTACAGGVAASQNTRQLDVATQIALMVNAVLDDPVASQVVAWWSVSPEELRSWKSEEMCYLKLVRDTIRTTEKARKAPARPIMMYEPSNRTASGLQITGQFLDMQLQGAYYGHLPKDSTNPCIAARSPNYSVDDPCWIDAIDHNMKEALKARAINNNTPLIALNMNKDYEVSDAQVLGYVRRAVYAGLLDGAQGVMVWSYVTRPGFTAKKRDVVLTAYKSVAKDLNGLLNLAPYFMRGEVVTSTLPVTLMEGKSVTQLRFRQYRYNGKNLLISMNVSDTDSVSANIPQNGNFRRAMGVVSSNVNVLDASIGSDGKIHVSLKPMQIGMWFLE
jgi:hypothetical protein